MNDTIPLESKWKSVRKEHYTRRCTIMIIINRICPCDEQADTRYTDLTGHDDTTSTFRPAAGIIW